MEDFSKYEQMRDRGISPREVYTQAKFDGVDLIKTIRMLRCVFGLSLAEAKEATGAGEVWSAGQEIKPGALVYWESQYANDFQLFQARVKHVTGPTVEVAEHRKFRLTDNGLDELPVDGTEPASVSAALLAKPLSDRLGELLRCIDQRRTAGTATKKAV